MYEAVMIYDNNGFVGYTIRKKGVDKLHTMNLWTQEDIEDLKQQISTLNSSADIRNFWPDVRDPEVQILLNDPFWEPAPLTETQVIDEEASNLVLGETDPLTLEAPLLESESNIVYKTILVPSPAGTTARVRKACEVVAVRRAEEALTSQP